MANEGKANEPKRGGRLKEGVENDERSGEEMRDHQRKLSYLKG